MTRTFRFPTKTARKGMSIEDLEETVRVFEDWYMMYEEDMTCSTADKLWGKKEELEQYIESRKAECIGA